MRDRMPSTCRSAAGLRRAGDPAVLDQERPVAGDRRDQRLLRPHQVRVPEARHVDAALDRRAQLVLVRRAAAGQDQVGGARALGVAARRERVAGGPRARPARRCAGRARRAWATPSWISGTGASGVPSASMRARERGGEARRVRRGSPPGRRRCSPSRPDQRAAALGVGEPVEGGARRAARAASHGVRLHHDRVVARGSATGSPGARALRRPLGDSAAASRPAGGHARQRRRSRCGRPARCRSPS